MLHYFNAENNICKYAFGQVFTFLDSERSEEYIRLTRMYFILLKTFLPEILHQPYT